MPRIPTAALIVLTWMPATWGATTPTLQEDFEDGAILPFRTEGSPPHEIDVVAPGFGARAGSRCHRLRWLEDAYDGTRATRGVEGHSSGSPRITSEGWYAFSFHFPSGSFPTDKNLIFAQIIAWTSALPQTNKSIVVSTNADGSVQVKAHHGVGDGGVTETGVITLWGAGQTALRCDRWHDLIIHVRWSRNQTGVVRAWLDGAPESHPTGTLANINVGNGAWSDDNLLTDGAYVKWGIYAWDVAHHTDHETRTVYIDEIAYLVGNPAGAFAAVAPAGYGADRSIGIRLLDAAGAPVSCTGLVQPGDLLLSSDGRGGLVRSGLDRTSTWSLTLETVPTSAQ